MCQAPPVPAEQHLRIGPGDVFVASPGGVPWRSQIQSKTFVAHLHRIRLAVDTMKSNTYRVRKGEKERELLNLLDYL